MAKKAVKKKFTSADLLKDKEIGRHYDFSNEQVLKWAQEFVQRANYELQEPAYIGFICPTLHAKRQIENATHELIAVSRQNIAEALGGLGDLTAIKAIVGDKPDYAVLFPPLNEYEWVEFFHEDNGRWLKEIAQQQVMMWMCNPDDRTVWCLAGKPKDEIFEDYFIFSKGLLFGSDLASSMLQQQAFKDMVVEEGVSPSVFGETTLGRW